MDRIVSRSGAGASLLSTHKVLRNTYFLLGLTPVSYTHLTLPTICSV